MAEVLGVAGGEDEIELDLGLSIGGIFRKLPPEKSITIDRDGCTDISRSRLTLSRTGSSGSPLTLVSDGDNGSAVMDSKERHEIKALRGREAKRKQQRRGGWSVACQIEEEEEEERQRPWKKEKKEDVGSQCNVTNNVDLNLSDNQMYGRDNYRTNASSPKQDPATQMAHTYSSLHHVPFMNGYAYPWVMPYWAAGAAINRGNEKSVHQPVACRSFRPFQMNQNGADVSSLNGCKLEQNGSEDGRNWKTESRGSPVCSSSVVSDNYQSSSSHEDGSCIYTRSNSSNSSSDRHQITGLNASDHMNNGSSPHQPKPSSDNRTQHSEKFVQSHVSKASTTGNSGIKKESIISDKPEVPSSKSVSNTIKCTTISPKNINMENGKPPKPRIQSRDIPSLQQMPCVSTTGITGKTIIGFLYRYSKLEVSILCVCHGESFSPAEFVKHAGGAEVPHPLRHITVLPTHNGVPSAFR